MRSRFDGLDAAELRRLLDLALTLLPPTGRRALLAQAPKAEDGPALLDTAQATADALLRLLDEREDEVVAAWSGDGHPEIRDEIEAATAELEDALGEAAAWLGGEAGDDGLASRAREAVAAARRVQEWTPPRFGGVRFGDRNPWPAAAAAIEAWAAAAAGCAPEELAARWPVPPAGVRVAAVLGTKLGPARVAWEALARSGDASGARWLLVEHPRPARVLGAYAHLAPDLAAAWSARLRGEEKWSLLAEGAARGIAVPALDLFEAWVQLGRIGAALELGVRAPQVGWERLWDLAEEHGELLTLRALARGSTRPGARWVGNVEAELLELPKARYDHELTKGVVAYATARLGAPPSPAASWELPGPLLQRIAGASDPHDAQRCFQAALVGLERLVAFHVAGRSRSRYGRAAAYWAEHARMAERAGVPERHAALEERFGDELRRLPALRTALGLRSAP